MIPQLYFQYGRIASADSDGFGVFVQYKNGNIVSRTELLQMNVKIIRTDTPLLGCGIHLIICIHNYRLFVMEIISFQKGIINKPAQ